MNGEFLEALDQLEKAKGIPKASLIQTVEAAMQSAYRKHFGTTEEVRLDIDEARGTVRMIARKPIYPQVELDRLDWKLGSAGMPAADGLAPVEAQLLVQARLPAEYGAQQRRALELVDALVLDLGRAADGLQVKVTRPPFDLESGQVLRGGARSDRSGADSTPQFALLISRGLAP